MSAIALIGFTAAAIGNGTLHRRLQERKQKKNKIAAIDSQIEAILAENASMRQDIEVLSTSLDKMIIQNKKLQASNKKIAQELEEEQERVVKLMDIITEDNEEKLALTRKLEEANNRLMEYAAVLSDRHGVPEDTKAKGSIA